MKLLALINRPGGLYGRILTEVTGTVRFEWRNVKNEYRKLDGCLLQSACRKVILEFWRGYNAIVFVTKEPAVFVSLQITKFTQRSECSRHFFFWRLIGRKAENRYLFGSSVFTSSLGAGKIFSHTEGALSFLNLWGRILAKPENWNRDECTGFLKSIFTNWHHENIILSRVSKQCPSQFCGFSVDEVQRCHC